VDLNVVLKLVTTDLELKIEETNTVIESSSLPVITAIPSQMIQLFTNIIANAIKFKKPAEAPLLKVSSEPLTDKEKASRFLVPEKLYYKIVVSDAGIGFEQEYAAKIFQIFQRLHGKAEYPGSGIGLAICKKIVDNHNGIIYAESAPGRGSTFSFIFPEKQ
jgi:light-regulated signal transduction histidine kinase (bacteriophytochrome)